MMRWPSEYTALIRLGYTSLCTRKVCDCGIEIRWFLTPARKHMALSEVKDGRLVPHASICARAKALRAAAKGEHGDVVQNELFAGEALPTRETARDAGPVFSGAAYDPSLDHRRL